MTAVVGTVFRAVLHSSDGYRASFHRDRDSAAYVVAQHIQAAGPAGACSYIDEIPVICAFCDKTCHCENDE